jgi:hypothetical protein
VRFPSGKVQKVCFHLFLGVHIFRENFGRMTTHPNTSHCKVAVKNLIAIGMLLFRNYSLSLDHLGKGSSRRKSLLEKNIKIRCSFLVNTFCQTFGDTLTHRNTSRREVLGKNELVISVFGNQTGFGICDFRARILTWKQTLKSKTHCSVREAHLLRNFLW